MVKDISTRKDIEKLMTRFYSLTLDDLVIGFIFTDIADFDLDSHIPVISDFWETVLFGTSKYKGSSRVMDVHMDLNKKVPLKKGHFDRWLYLFNKSVDEMFAGPYADKAKGTASGIAAGMQKRLELEECSHAT